jgi:hypothetical protein
LLHLLLDATLVAGRGFGHPAEAAFPSGAERGSQHKEISPRQSGQITTAVMETLAVNLPLILPRPVCMQKYAPLAFLCRFYFLF